MTATTLKTTEGTPASWPAVTGLSTAAAALDAGMIWQRIEAYTAWRWAARSVAWIVEGPGEWAAPLAPATITARERWTGEAWEAVTLTPTATGGYDLPEATHYRITANVGAGPVPEPVAEAFRRLAEYSAEGRDYGMWKGRPGASSVDVKLGEGLSQSFDRAPTWLARAMQNSGAGDLLRPYRRA